MRAQEITGGSPTPLSCAREKENYNIIKKREKRKTAEIRKNSSQGGHEQTTGGVSKTGFRTRKSGRARPAASTPRHLRWLGSHAARLDGAHCKGSGAEGAEGNPPLVTVSVDFEILSDPATGVGVLIHVFVATEFDHEITLSSLIFFVNRLFANSLSTRYLLHVARPFVKPSDIPQDGIPPDKLAALSGVDLGYIQGRTLQGRTPVVKGKISKRDALILLRDAARAERDAQVAAQAQAAATAQAQVATIKVANAVVHQQRLGKIADMLAQMIPNRTIRDQLSAQWGITPDAVTKLIGEAYSELAELGKVGQAARKDQMRDAFAEFYTEAMNIGDLKTAAIALDRLAKIDGCYAPTSSRVELEASEALAGSLNAPDSVRDRIAKYLQDPELLARIEKLTKGS